MWMLALGGIFLAAAQACVLCRFPDHDLSGRLAQLCSQMEAQWKDCEVSWNFSVFALDDASLKKVTEKTHRVLRVMEIKGSLSSLLSYWKWLQKTKLPEYNREALCAPACRGSTILYNCSTCQGFEVYCWPRKRCFPGPHSPPLPHPAQISELLGYPSIDGCGPRDHSLPPGVPAGSHDLWEARILLLFVSGATLLLGILSFAVEYSHLQANSDL
ncbi:transmembrane protein 95 isoform X1 [Phocoena sinus]|uniref:transmembrane protein 95 isoform X1 n=1 Tax=Phocoena sinus TaxID=42100 RepID=UPI0013C53AAD|nr:transmembrane protein 95 isoform X1 [Phocoena sinus]XP_032472035.1 transmembrane protein 95 isoform X1 [Phocoena sinus]